MDYKDHEGDDVHMYRERCMCTYLFVVIQIHVFYLFNHLHLTICTYMHVCLNVWTTVKVKSPIP